MLDLAKLVLPPLVLEPTGYPLYCGNAFLVVPSFCNELLLVILQGNEGLPFLIDEVFDCFVVLIKPLLMFLLLEADCFLLSGDDCFLQLIPVILDRQGLAVCAVVLVAGVLGTFHGNLSLAGLQC